MANTTNLTPEKKERFLSELRKMPNVSHACRVVKVARQTAYAHREEDKEFGVAWDDALIEGVESLEESAWKQAKKGSDTLTIFLLKAHAPEKYRETIHQEHSGSIDTKVTVLSEVSDEDLDRIIAGKPPSS